MRFQKISKVGVQDFTECRTPRSAIELHEAVAYAIYCVGLEGLNTTVDFS